MVVLLYGYGHVVGQVYRGRAPRRVHHRFLVLLLALCRLANGSGSSKLLRYHFVLQVFSYTCANRQGGYYASRAILLRGYGRFLYHYFVFHRGVLGISARDNLGHGLVFLVRLGRV